MQLSGIRVEADDTWKNETIIYFDNCHKGQQEVEQNRGGGRFRSREGLLSYLGN